MGQDISTDMPAGEAGAPAGETLIDGQWKPGVWNELPQLTCVRCQWDTLDGIEAARAYKAKCPRCGPAELPASPTSGLLIADRWGNPVNMEGK
jgi:hypothetical protein